MNISLLYEDLYDAKTRLKELFDIQLDRLGPLVYEEQKDELFTTSFIYRLDGAKYQVRPDGTVNMSKITGQYRKILISKGTATLKADAQQNAAAEALKKLASQGFVKHTPSIYTKFASNQDKSPTSLEDVLKLCGSVDKIDDLLPTRGKTKYQNKYISTALHKYCRQRDYDGIKISLELGANPNILDSDGMSATDLLLIGTIRPKEIKKILKKFLKTEDNLLIRQSVKNTYFTHYLKDPDNSFLQIEKTFTIIEDPQIENKEQIDEETSD